MRDFGVTLKHIRESHLEYFLSFKIYLRMLIRQGKRTCFVRIKSTINAKLFCQTSRTFMIKYIQKRANISKAIIITLLIAIDRLTS